MLGFLRRPPPLFAALLNAFIGFCFPAVAILALFAFVVDFGIAAPPIRWLIVPGTMQIMFAAVAGIALGLAACAVMIWAAPDVRREALPALAEVSLAFAACAVAALIGARIYWHGVVWAGLEIPRSEVLASIILTACGSVVAFTMARGARRLGVIPIMTPGWIALLGGVLAGLGASAMLFSAWPVTLEIPPMLWLGLVTYFCLKPLPQKQTDGL